MQEPEIEELAADLGDRYVLEGVLGRSASAVVFLALDRRHDRRVALKVLRDAATPERAARFHREIAAAAHLQHPHILPLFDSGHAAGRLYYTMPHVPGGTLRDRLRRDGRVSPAEALRLGRQMADALACAHAAGVVHRDLRPENVMLSATGHALLADFGAAQAAGAPAEGAEGGMADERADVQALGAVLFEAVTGAAPHPRGHSPSATPWPPDGLPASPYRLRGRIPMRLDAVIRRAMVRRPGEPHFSAAAFGTALTEAEGRAAASRRRRAVGLGAGVTVLAAVALGWLAIARRAPPEPRLLVVLPFKNLGAASDQYFADGLTEEITSRLAGLSGLRVISRTSADQYRQTTKTLRQIGAELGAAYVVEGSVRWDRSTSPGRIRVTPQLIRASDDSHLWSAVYDAQLTEVFRIQSTIAEGVTSALDVALGAPERAALSAASTRSPEAYDHYLRGNDYLGHSFERSDVTAAVDLYSRAVALDSGFAPAWARLSRAHSAMYWFYHDRTEGRLRLARDAADHALRLAPDRPEGHIALGYYYYWGRLDYRRAVEELEAARRLQPSNADLLAAIGYVERRLGHWDQAIARLSEANRYDPRSTLRTMDLGDTYMSIRMYPEAEHYLERTIALAPDWANPYAYKANLYLVWRGDVPGARAVLGQALARLGPGKLAPAMLTGDRISGAPFTADTLFQPAIDQLSLATFAGDSVRYHLLKAEAAWFRGMSAAERAHADSARALLEAGAPGVADDPRRLVWLALAYASLGRHPQAIKAAERAAELMPVSADANSGPFIQTALARVLLRAGRVERAIDVLEPLLGIPSWISPAELRTDPTWAALRTNPRFRNLLR